MNNLSGQSLGRYHLIEKLGEGGMAVVYKAFDTRLECEVAVKIIRVEDLPQSGVERSLKRFEREAKAVAQLNHPNIVRVMDYGEQDGLPFLVMPYQPGGTLKGVLGKPIPYQEAAHLLAPVARALQYAHSRNIIHRDVKPSNILITESGEPMLTDFGIAKILDLQDGQTLTGTGVGIGTPEYMAPEQWTGSITPAVDIYSLGVVFYELVTGHKPYTAETPAAVLLKQATEPLPRPSIYVPGLPEKVEQVIYKAMAKKAEDRYQDMQEFERALEQLRAGVNIPVTRENEPVSTNNDQFATMATSTDTMETRVERNLNDTGKPNEPKAARQQPTSPTEVKKPKKVGLFAGLGTLALVMLFFVIGNSTNWFRRIQATEEPTIAPKQPPTTAPISSNTSIPEATPALGIGSTMISEIDGMEMVYVPAGDFLMGSADGFGEDDEYPQHTVYLDAYWIDKTEVTNGMYEQCVAAGVCSEPSYKASNLRNTYYGNNNYSNYPVIHVDWNQAQTYCKWAGRQLPTEAQWEKAARGVEGAMYPWGNQYPKTNLANYDALINDTTQVGTYPTGASPYGALDMAGNVWEWVADWYSDSEYRQNEISNPLGPSYGETKVLRGESWGDDINDIRSANRGSNLPSHSWDAIGFRCALPLN